MKEKTFEELVKDEIIDKDNWLTIKEADLIIELLQQVREATIAECHLIADKYYFQNSEKIIIDINSLPTNSIKTDL